MPMAPHGPLLPTPPVVLQHLAISVQLGKCGRSIFIFFPKRGGSYDCVRRVWFTPDVVNFAPLCQASSLPPRPLFHNSPPFVCQDACTKTLYLCILWHRVNWVIKKLKISDNLQDCFVSLLSCFVCGHCDSIDGCKNFNNVLWNALLHDAGLCHIWMRNFIASQYQACEMLAYNGECRNIRSRCLKQ